MFGFITALLKIIVSVTPQALADRRKARERELGARLFHLYLTAYIIADRGDYIIKALQMARSVMDSPNPEVESRWHSELEQLLNSQSHSFQEFKASVLQFGVGLAALDPETFMRIQRHMSVKGIGVNQFLEAFGSYTFPLEAPRESLDEMLTVSTDSAAITLFELIYSRPQQNGRVDVAAELNEATVAMIETYLNELRPEQDLIAIRESLATLRKALDENFKVGEILLELTDLQIEGSSFQLPTWKHEPPAM